MSQIEKLLRKFADKPESVRYVELEKILRHFDFEKIQAKGSHVKFKHTQLSTDLIIPVHRNECKNFYKKQVRKQIAKLLKKYEN